MAQAYKVMLLGEIGVGKSSLAQRLVFDRFSREYKPTIGVEVYRYAVAAADASGEPLSLIIWDTDGNFGDAIFRHVYMKQASAAVIVGDQSRPDTVDAMARIARGFAEALPGRVVHFILNKSDLGPIDDTLLKGLPSGLELTRTSALQGAEVEAAFRKLAGDVVRRGY